MMTALVITNQLAEDRLALCCNMKPDAGQVSERLPPERPKLNFGEVIPNAEG
jgi:hypothetical protein